MTAPSHLRSFQALELALRTGSLKAAADALAISPAAVGQRVKALEDYLGVDLVVRGRSGLQPTPALAAAMPRLTTAFRELDAVAAALDLQRPQEIHVATRSDFAELWLSPRLAAFRDTHPNVRFCVNGEGDAPLRLGAQDVEITFGPEKPDADLLFHDYVVPICSQENVDRVRHLAERDRLEGFPLLHIDFYRDDPAAPDWAEWSAARNVTREAPQRGMRFQRIAAALGAVDANAGVGLCGLALIEAAVEQGRVVFPFALSTGTWTSHAFQARLRPEALARAPVRAFRQWLLAESARTTRWMERLVGAQRRS